MKAANPAGVTSRVAAPMPLIEPADAFDAALSVARAGHGLTFVAMHAPVVAPSAIVRAWPEGPVVAWSSPGSDGDPPFSLAGVGIARELRGRGADRWHQLRLAAEDLGIHGAVICERSRRRLAPPAALGLGRPRFVGGAAFAPGAADRGPWSGFGDAWFVLPRWTYTSDGMAAWLVLAVDELEARDHARWRAELAILENAARTPQDTTAVAEISEIVRGSAELWRAQVEAITATIEGGACSKIVAARTCSIALAAPLASIATAANLLDALDTRHAECTRLLIRPPGAGALVGATPERLVRRDGTTIRCDALAGTIRVADLPADDAAATLLASAKDRREHELVVRAIRTALADLGGDVAAPDEPTIRTLRHVLHLHTPFRATTRAPRHVLELAGRLHPTPAVGGTPTDFAIDWIRDHEPVPRGWYASPVGWFDLAGDGELAVALRSGVVTGKHIHLWAGAGIVAGSDPEQELAETELKLRAMLGALGVGP